MRILQIIHSLDPAAGGVTEGVNQLSATLVRRGHKVETVSLDSEDAPCLKSSPVTARGLGPSLSGYGLNLRFVKWLRERRGEYDAAIVNGLWQFHSFGTWMALRNSETPYFVYPHGMLDPWFKKKYPAKHFKKWLYWPWAEYRVLRDAQAVLFTCEEERLLARKSFWLYRCKEAVVSLGTSSPAGDPEEDKSAFFWAYPDLRGKKLALFLGRIHPKKGCDLLIASFAEVLAAHPEWHLVMAGPDQVGWKDKLTQQAQELGIGSRITWTGMLSGELKWGALQASEIFVLPSHQENFGVAVAEALASGVPALISDKVNIWREIVGDAAGLVGPDTLEGINRMLRTYLDMPPAEMIRMRIRAKNCFTERFEIEKAAENLEQTLLNLTGWKARLRNSSYELYQT